MTTPIFHYAHNQRVYLRRDPSQYGRIGCGGYGDVYDRETKTQLVFWEHEGADVVTLEKIDDLMSEEEYHERCNRLAGFFAHLSENLALIENDLEQDLNDIHTIEFTPHLGGHGWWMDVNVDQFVWVDRDRQGRLEIVFEGYHSDYEEMYAQPQPTA